MFIEVKDEYGIPTLINLKAISSVCVPARTITLYGVHGDGNGLYHLTEEDIANILKHIEICEVE